MKLTFATKKLGSFINKVNTRVSDSPHQYKNWPVFGVTNKEGVVVTGKAVSEDLSNYIVVEGESFVFNPYRINVGSIGLTEKNFRGLVSPAYVVFKASNETNLEFLFYYLKSSLGINLIKWYGDRGGVRDALRFDDLSKIDFPDLNFDQQSKVLVNLKKINGIQNSIQEELDNQMLLIEELRKRVLEDAVEGKYIAKSKIGSGLPVNWEIIQLQNIGEVNPKNKAQDNSKAAFVPMPLVSGKFGITPSYEERLWGEIKKGYTHFQNGDVVLAKITPCFENSKAGIMQNLINGIGAGTTELYVFRANQKKVLPEYVYIYFKSSNFLNQGEKKMTGSAGQKRVPRDYVFTSPFPLPPIEDQKQIIKQANKLMDLCNQFETQISEARIQSEHVLESYIQESFQQVEKPSPNWFALKQGIGAVMEALTQTPYERGEMVIAKIMFILQEIKKIDFGLQFVRHNFGPYDPNIKKAILASAFGKDKFFKVKGSGEKQVYSLGDNISKLFFYNSGILNNTRSTLNEIMPHLQNLKSSQIELIATICKIIQDIQSVDLQSIQKELTAWKGARFSKADIQKALQFILSLKWENSLIKE